MMQKMKKKYHIFMIAIPITVFHVTFLADFHFLFHADNLWLTPAFQTKKYSHEAFFHVLKYLFVSSKFITFFLLL